MFSEFTRNSLGQNFTIPLAVEWLETRVEIMICDHVKIMPRARDGAPVLHRCNGRDFHLVLISGPRRQLVQIGARRRMQIVCSFAYVKRQKLGYALLAMPDRANARAVMRMLRSAADRLSVILQGTGQAASVFRSDEAGQILPFDP